MRYVVAHGLKLLAMETYGGSPAHGILKALTTAAASSAAAKSDISTSALRARALWEVGVALAGELGRVLGGLEGA
jgi:hypothetical protein